MPTRNNSPFTQWLDQILSERGWNDYQLSQRAGISHSVISKARSGTIPKWEACEAIATALQVPTELVFRKAGLLPPGDDGLGLEEWRYLLERLPSRDRHELLLIARLKLNLLEQEPGGNGHSSEVLSQDLQKQA